MKRLFLGAFILLDLLIAGWAPSLALANTPTTSYDGSPIIQKITIHGIVPIMRFIYVDNQDKILRVVGNTSLNIVPRVILASNFKDIELSPYINAQYQQILSTNGGNLVAGLTYYPSMAPSQPDETDQQIMLPAITSLKLSI